MNYSYDVNSSSDDWWRLLFVSEMWCVPYAFYYNVMKTMWPVIHLEQETFVHPGINPLLLLFN